MKKKDISGKMENFAQKYVEIGNASAAYRQAYETKAMQIETIHRKAKELLDNGKVAARIKELQEMHLERHKATIDRVVAELEKLAFVDARNFFEDDGTLKPLSQLDKRTAASIVSLEVDQIFDGKGKDRVNIGKHHKIKIADKKGALDSLAKILGAMKDKDEGSSGSITIINYGDTKDGDPTV